ncbi:MAG: PatB family C-S lyase [Burkholderiales bacterium]|nr:PatB family C-S lyase [Burkholderiales bacterium]
MTFDFDTCPERRNTGSTKWNRYSGRDVIPLWVADMDFRCAPEIVEALHARVEHGVFGYTEPPAELAPVICDVLARDHGWNVDPEWIIWLPSLVVGLNVVSRALADEGDAVLTTVPIYPPFMSAPRNAERTLLTVPLVTRALPGGAEHWEWDWEALEAAVTPHTRLLLLCSPHNPTGRVWSDSELQTLAHFAARHDLLVVSDEIHCGLVLDTDKRHRPFAGLDTDTSKRTVTLMSASKTFNLPSLGCAFAIASDPQLRARLRRTMAGIVHHVGGLGYTATLAAYRDAGSWHQALLHYLSGNRDLVETALSRMPGLRSWHVEATYLSWIDARGLGTHDPLRLFESAGVGLYDGAQFDAPGFLRLNFACPRTLLREALQRMRAALPV